MLKTLRGRFILSHILPLLIVIPLMGIGTIFLIEEGVVVPSLVSEMEGNVLMLSHLAAQDPMLFQDAEYAQLLITQGAFPTDGRIMFLGSDETLLASSDRDDADRIGALIQPPGIEAARDGQAHVELRFSEGLGDDIADAIAPVMGSEGELLGYMRLSYPYYTFADQIYRLRYLLSGILALGLLLGAGLGVALAINVAAPVAQVTRAVDALANGERKEALPESGAEETRRLSHAVNMLVERLRGLEAARKRLLANLVHEIGRPLGALRMGIEALSHGAAHDPQFYGELLAGMDQETARLQHLVEDLARLHEQALGPLEMDYQPLDWANWLPEVLLPWQVAAEEKGLSWELQMQEGLPQIQGDALRLAQVVGNLVSNAIKFTPAGGSVTVETSGDEQGVWLRVADTGPGIPPEEQEEAFTPFVRNGRGRRFPQGMGLGLSIARELTEAHGGKLTLASEEGRGATFTMWLPIRPPKRK